jgi:hypothetical protein
MDVFAGLYQPCAIIAAQGTGADDRDAGFIRKRGAHNVPVVPKMA